MSSEVAVEARGLSKVYELYRRPQDRLKQLLYRGSRRFYQEHAALQNITFAVSRGEVLAIIGRNGSGKSTLLQLIAGTLCPSGGELRTKGRVTTLLDLSAGLNLDFTGRENIYLQAAMAGLSRAETDRRFDDILSFAELEKAVDDPVNTYSSGMLLRLAFSLATSGAPDILVVDEALAVGDELFQRKCFGRIEALRSDGSTVIFVSHSEATVLHLSDRALLLDGGERLLLGSPKQVVSRYHRLLFSPPDRTEEIRQELRTLDREPTTSEVRPFTSAPALRIRSILGDDTEAGYDPQLTPTSTVSYVTRGAEIHDPRFETEYGRCANVLTPNALYYYTYDVAFSRAAFNVRFGMLLKNVRGVQIGGLVSHPPNRGIDVIEAGLRVRVRFPLRNRLTQGTYFANAGVLGVIDGSQAYLHRILDAVVIKVTGGADALATALVDLSDGLEIVVDRVRPTTPSTNAGRLPR